MCPTQRQRNEISSHRIGACAVGISFKSSNDSISKVAVDMAGAIMLDDERRYRHMYHARENMADFFINIAWRRGGPTCNGSSRNLLLRRVLCAPRSQPRRHGE